MNCPTMTEPATAAWLLFLIGFPLSLYLHLELSELQAMKPVV